MVSRADINIGAPSKLRPEVEVDGRLTRVLAEQTAAVDPSRLGDGAGRLTFDEMRRVDAALRLILGRQAPINNGWNALRHFPTQIHGIHISWIISIIHEKSAVFIR